MLSFDWSLFLSSLGRRTTILIEGDLRTKQLMIGMVEDHIGIVVFAIHPDFKMEMLRGGPPGTPRQCYLLPALHLITYLHQILRVMAI